MKNTIAVAITALGILLPQASFAGPQRGLLAFLNVQPGTERQFIEAAKEVVVESRKEPGAILYILHQEVKDSTRFVIYELYKTEEDLQTHKNSKHVIDFLKRVNPILIPNGFTLVEYR